MNYTHCPLDVCSKSVTNVDVPGHRQLLASKAYLNSSSHTTCSAKTKRKHYQQDTTNQMDVTHLLKNEPGNVTWNVSNGRFTLANKLCGRIIGEEMKNLIEA